MQRTAREVPADYRALENASKAFDGMEAARKKWSETIPKSEDTLWTWCLEQTQETLLKILAFCAPKPGNAANRDSRSSPVDASLQTASASPP